MRIFCCTPHATTPLTLQILVVSDAPSTFVITSTTVSRELLNGVVTSGTVPAGTALYFTFDAGASSTNVHVTLQSMAGTVALAYIAPALLQPNATTAKYRIGGQFGEFIALNPTADGCVSSQGSSSGFSSCLYGITVVSASPRSAAVFRLQATASLVVKLDPGMPTPGVANPDSISYFSVKLEPGSNGLSLIAQVRP